MKKLGWGGVGCLVGYELTYMDVHTQKKNNIYMHGYDLNKVHIEKPEKQTRK